VRAEAKSVDVPALIDAHKVSRFQIAVTALCGAVVFMDGFDAQAIGYVASSPESSARGAWTCYQYGAAHRFCADCVRPDLLTSSFAPSERLVR
jgi:hypothetical protein